MIILQVRSLFYAMQPNCFVTKRALYLVVLSYAYLYL